MTEKFAQNNYSAVGYWTLRFKAGLYMVISCPLPPQAGFLVRTLPYDMRYRCRKRWMRAWSGASPETDVWKRERTESGDRSMVPAATSLAW
jgi:hypothetical protein